MADDNPELVEKVRGACGVVLRNFEDDAIFEYIVHVTADQYTSGITVTSDDLFDAISPFLLSSAFSADEDSARATCQKLFGELSRRGAGQKIKAKNKTGSVSGGAAKGGPTGGRSMADMMANESDAAHQQDWMNFMWGFDKVRKERNTQLDFADTKNRRQQRREAKQQGGTVNTKEEEDSEDDFVPPQVTEGTGEKDIHVDRFGIQYKGNELLLDTSLKLIYGHRYGLVGRNGIGKTTLLKFIARFDIEGFPTHHRVLHVQQEVSADGRSVLQTVIEGDHELKKLLEEEKALLASQDDSATERLNVVYDRLRDKDSEGAESRARGILTGLGFSPEMQDGATNSLSGGWRMRVAIASALFVEPDLLMLDEPTNHLDLEAVLWLENYLQNYDKSLIIVSHDRRFLDDVITDVIHFYNRQLNYYKGDYKTFEGTREERLKNLKKQYEAQMQKRAHMQEFIDKFRYNAKRASLVQSRIKALEKLPRVEEPHEEAEFRFSFPPPEPLGRPIIQVDSVCFGYTKENLLFKDVDIGIDMESRIGVVGPNGAGKSTLLNLVLGKLTPMEGQVNRHMKLRIAFFTQHHTDQIDLELTAVQNMLTKYNGTKDEEVRRHLGRFGVSGELAMKPCKFLSGGEKSRVAFALLTWPKPHVLIMDEPTNHLDMETIDALILAIKDYPGGVVVVSHDQHFIESVATELWVVADKSVKQFKGEFKDYKKSVLKHLAMR